MQDFFHQEYAYIPLKLTAKHLKIRGFVNGEPSLPFENPTFFVPVAATFLPFREVLLQPLSTLGKWSVLTTPDTQNHHIWQEIPFKNPWFRVSIGSKNTDIFHHHSDVLRLEDFRVGLSEPQNVMGKPSIWPKAKRHVVWRNSCFQQVLMTPLNLKHLFPKKMFFFFWFPKNKKQVSRRQTSFCRRKTRSVRFWHSCIIPKS